jgi:hypothetical protein
MKQAGIVIIVIGILITIFSGYSFVTKKKVVDLGPLEITESKRHTFPIAPVVGIAVIVVGAGMVFIGYTKKNSA